MRTELTMTFEFEFDGTEKDFYIQLRKTMLVTIEEIEKGEIKE